MRHRPALAFLIVATGLLALFVPRPAPRPVRLAFMGDVMLGRDVARAHADGDWGASAAALRPLTSDVDLVVANLESPITAAPMARPALDLRAPPGSAVALRGLGFDLVTLANNHALDAGETGLRDTIDALRSAGIEHLGPSPGFWRRTIHGLDIALIAFNDTQQDLDLRAMRQEVGILHGRGALVVVSIHWGMELQPVANERQRGMASAAAQAGADVIVGHGPHVLQEAEWIWGVGRGRPTLVAYSLGNALFDSTSPPAARRSAGLIVEVGAGGALTSCALPLSVNPPGWDISAASQPAAKAILDSLRPGEGRSPAVMDACP